MLSIPVKETRPRPHVLSALNTRQEFKRSEYLW